MIARRCFYRFAWFLMLLAAPAAVGTLACMQHVKAETSRQPAGLTLEREVKEGGDWLVFNSKGTELIVCENTTVKILDARTLAVRTRYTVTGKRAAAALGDRFLVVGGIFVNGIELLDRANGSCSILNYGTAEFQCHSRLDLLAYRKTSRKGDSIVLYDLAKKTTLKQWKLGDEKGSARVAGFSERGALLAFYDGFAVQKTVLAVMNPPYDKPPTTIESAATASTAPVFSPDGKGAALATTKAVVEVWDLHKKSKVSQAVKGVGGSVVRLAYSPDGKLLACLATGKGFGEVVVWRVSDFQEIARVRAHNSETRGLAFFPDGKRLVTASRDARLKVWVVNQPSSNSAK